MARMSDDDRFAFLLGAWVPVASSWIQEAMYESEVETLWIRTTTEDYPYPNVPFSLAEGFSYAPSQGQWMWQVLWRTGRSYSPAGGRYSGS